MAKFQKDQMLVARRNATVELDGRTVRLRKGVSRVRGNDPVVKGREELFKPADVTIGLEETSSAPGRLRGNGDNDGE